MSLPVCKFNNCEYSCDTQTKCVELKEINGEYIFENSIKNTKCVPTWMDDDTNKCFDHIEPKHCPQVDNTYISIENNKCIYEESHLL